MAEGILRQTQGLHAEFGDRRVIDTPIFEAGMFGMAVGAAVAGMRSVVEIMFSDFLTLVMDQLVNHAAKIHYLSGGGFSVPLMLRTIIGVGGVLGSTHSQTLYAWPAHIPGLKLAAPSTPADAKGLMTTAIRDDNPVLNLEDRMTYNLKGSVPEGGHIVELWVADVKREGSDVTLIAFSRMVHVALEAAEALAEKGVSAQVVDPRSIVPLDTETLIESVAGTGRAVAEILGRADGFNKGRGGSAGLTVREAGFLATTGQVGAGIGLGIGDAQAQKIKGQGGICVTFFGDGGLEEGIGFEAMNTAALYDLPVLLVCENNSVGVTTGRAQNEWSSSSMAAETLGDVPRALGITSEVVPGESVTAVYDAASRLIGDLREGRAPAFIEMRTRRWPGSRSFNPQLVTGVTELAGIWKPGSVTGEHSDWINRYDPVIGYGRELMRQDRVDRDEIRAMDERIVGQVRAAREFALSSPPPSAESGLTGTFA